MPRPVNKGVVAEELDRDACVRARKRAMDNTDRPEADQSALMGHLNGAIAIYEKESSQRAKDSSQRGRNKKAG